MYGATLRKQAANWAVRIKKARIKKMALYRELSSEFEKIKMRTELSPIGFPFTGAKLGLLARPYKYIEKEA